jgi:hypothetical protein
MIIPITADNKNLLLISAITTAKKNLKNEITVTKHQSIVRKKELCEHYYTKFYSI